MAECHLIQARKETPEKPISSNVKRSRKYDRFGETIWYLTVEELQKLFDCIDNYRHKLMFEMVYELGSRVGEFVRIRLRDLDFNRSSVFFPAENTKTGFRKTSHLPRGLMNEVKSLLKSQRRVTKRDERLLRPDKFLFLSPQGRNSAINSPLRLSSTRGLRMNGALGSSSGRSSMPSSNRLARSPNGLPRQACQASDCGPRVSLDTKCPFSRCGLMTWISVFMRSQVLSPSSMQATRRLHGAASG